MMGLQDTILDVAVKDTNKDLGVLRKHLGVWYKLKMDENGKCYLVATMPKKIEK